MLARLASSLAVLCFVSSATAREDTPLSSAISSGSPVTPVNVALLESPEAENSAEPQLPPSVKTDTSVSNYLLHSGSSGAGDDIAIVQRPEDSLYILQLVLGSKTVLDEGLLVYVLEDDDLLVPLSALVSALDFQVDVNPGAGTAEGWFINPERNFRLVYPYKEVTIAGETIMVEGIVETHIDEIYVSVQEIEKWFPIKLSLNFNELRLYLETTEDLPFQALAERRAAWLRSQSNASALPLIEPKDAIVLPYRKYAAPAIQLQQGINTNRNETTNSVVSSTSVQTQGDLLGMFSRFNLSYLQSNKEEQNGLQNSFFNLSRRDPRGEIGGRLGATELALGDVTANALPLVGGIQRGRGIKINNTPYNFVRSPDDFVVEGFAPEGWDAEIYQDERLLSFQTIGLGGRYVFDELQLREGFNQFRIVLYGPNGEKQVRYERYYFGRNMIKKGQFVYEVTGLESSTPLLNVENLPTTAPTFSAYGEYGVGDNISVNGGYYTAPLNGGTMNALGTGVRFGTSSAFYQFSTLVDVSGGYSLGANMAANLTKDITLTASHEMHESYSQQLRPIVQDSFVNFTQRFSDGFLKFGSYGFGLRRRLSATGAEVYTATNNISASLFGLSTTNNLEYELQETTGINRFNGDLTLRRRTSIGMLRGRFNYNLDDGFELRSTDLLYQTYLNADTSLNLLLNSTFGDNQENTVSGALTRRFDKFQLSTNASYADTGEIQLGLLLSMNFIPQSLQGDYRMTGDTSEVFLGSLEVEPFLDVNEDGVRNDNEELIKGVEMRNMLRNTRDVSNTDGTATLSGLTPEVVNRITVDQKTLPSIYMTPAEETINVVGRSGIAGPVGFPMILLGEVSGMLNALTPDKGLQALAGIEMLLLDDKEEVVAQAFSEYDGFFIFPSLRMGQYRLYLPPSADRDIYHRGDGLGPVFSLLPNEPEISDADIVLLDDRVIENGGSIPQTDYAYLLTPQTTAAEPETVEEEMDGQIMALPQAQTTTTTQGIRIEKVAKKPRPETRRRTGNMVVQAGYYCEEYYASRLYETLLVAGLNVAMTPRNAGRDCYFIDVDSQKNQKYAQTLQNYLTELGIEGAFIAD